MQQDYQSIDVTQNENPKRKTTRTAITVACILLVVVLAVITAILLKTYVLTTFIVNGISMYPTLDGGNGEHDDDDTRNGEVLFLNKIADIERGDIVVFVSPWQDLKDKTLVKRVIAVGGDHLQIIDNEVYINGEKLDEPYINGDMYTADLDVVIDNGYVFCMGDNRNCSNDCRQPSHGQISLDCVVGKCFLIKGIDGKLRSPK